MYLTIDDVADILCLPTETTQKQVDCGVIRSTRLLDGSVRVTEDDLRRRREEISDETNLGLVTTEVAMYLTGWTRRQLQHRIDTGKIRYVHLSGRTRPRRLFLDDIIRRLELGDGEWKL